MGDRCYLTFHLHGTIETVEHFEKIVEAIKAEWAQPDDYSGSHNIARHILASAAAKEPAGFVIEECNYANIDDLESVLQEIGLPYHVSHEEGGDYPCGCWTWVPVAGKVEAIRSTGTGPVVTVEDLRRALKGDDPLAEIADIISDADAADGKNLPPFALSDAVREHFAKRCG